MPWMASKSNRGGDSVAAMQEAMSESPHRFTGPFHRTGATSIRLGSPPPAVNDDFARRIKQAERAYRGARPAEYRLGLQSAVALCTLGQELQAPYRPGSPKFKAFETGWEDGILAWLEIHPDAFYLAGSALP